MSEELHICALSVSKPCSEVPLTLDFHATPSEPTLRCPVPNCACDKVRLAAPRSRPPRLGAQRFGCDTLRQPPTQRLINGDGVIRLIILLSKALSRGIGHGGQKPPVPAQIMCRLALKFKMKRIMWG